MASIKSTEAGLPPSVALVPSSVQNLKRAGVHYERIRGASANIEIGILRSLSINSELQENFMAMLKQMVQHDDIRRRRPRGRLADVPQSGPVVEERHRTSLDAQCLK